MHKLINNLESFDESADFEKIYKQFLPHAQKYLGFDKPVVVELVSDPENAKDPFGKTAYYNPNDMKITLFVDKRHVKDILRSLSHELVHHAQNCRGEFDKEINTEPGYAQNDPHMRNMEKQAYEIGNGLMFRDFEDNIKQKTLNLENMKQKTTYLLESFLKENKMSESKTKNKEKQEKKSVYDWALKTKNEKLFEELTKKWCKPSKKE
tara:strand:+ start:42 stop:665 length:624 start_codon:yes stop_codon:yes gene_type:complete